MPGREPEDCSTATTVPSDSFSFTATPNGDGSPATSFHTRPPIPPLPSSPQSRAAGDSACGVIPLTSPTMAPPSPSSSASPSSSPSSSQSSPPPSSSSSSSSATPSSAAAFPPASAGSVFATTSSPSSSPSPAASPDPASPAHNPHLFAERFLPPPVDPSHVISSAAPSSLPIELPAIRSDNCPDDPSSSSASSAAPLSTSHSSMAANTTTAISSSSQSAANYAANLRALTTFERWTLRASESQFNALAGAVGGFTAGVVTCPLDVIKTKLQAQGGFAALQRQQQAAAAAAAGTSPSVGATAAASTAGQNHQRLYNGLVGTARVIWRDEGIRGLYRGLGPIIMGYLPTWAVWFTVYNKSKIWMGERRHLQNTFVINFWSSVVAGASSTIVTNPIWVIKTRLMSQMPPSAVPHSTTSTNSSLATPWHYRSTIDAARKMYATEGILSFYSGLTPALLGLTHVAVQFPAYEYFKTKFTGVGMGESGGGSSGSSSSSSSSSDGGVEAPTHWLGVLSATILSKILASSLTYPHEVIRTRLQTQRRQAAKSSSSGGSSAAPRYRGVVATFQMILKEEGWHAFYAGMGTNMMRAVPAATVTMLTYEYVMRELKRTRHESRQQLAQ